MQELRDILALVRAWHAYNAARPNLAAGQKSARGFSHQLLWDTQIMIEGFLGLLSDLQVRHGSFIVRVRMLNQDSLESMFGRIRMACGSGNDVLGMRDLLLHVDVELGRVRLRVDEAEETVLAFDNLERDVAQNVNLVKEKRHLAAVGGQAGEGRSRTGRRGCGSAAWSIVAASAWACAWES